MKHYYGFYVPVDWMESKHYRILASVRPQPPRKKHFKIQQIHKVPVWLRADIGTGVLGTLRFTIEPLYPRLRGKSQIWNNILSSKYWFPFLWHLWFQFIKWRMCWRSSLHLCNISLKLHWELERVVFCQSGIF